MTPKGEMIVTLFFTNKEFKWRHAFAEKRRPSSTVQAAAEVGTLYKKKGRRSAEFSAMNPTGKYERRNRTIEAGRENIGESMNEQRERWLARDEKNSND